VGGVLGQLGRIEDALRDFSASLSIEPNDPLVLFNRGIVRLLWNDIDAALEDFNDSLTLREDPLALVNRGIALTTAGRHDEALTDFDRALDLDPGDPIARLNRASLLYVMGDLRGALNDMNLALPHLKARELREQAEKVHRLALEALLKDLAAKGFAYWAGGKPKGSKNPVRMTPGPSISEMIHEMRQ